MARTKTVRMYEVTHGEIVVEFYAVRTRTGTEIHLATGAQTKCGRFIRTHPLNMSTTLEVTCEKCMIALQGDGKPWTTSVKEVAR